MFFKKKTMLYFAPHQDDELLSMGIHICNSVKNRHDVHVILCSDGSKSAVRNTLKNGKACSKHEGTHDYELSVEEFIRARDKEFTDSCLALGVKRENIHIPTDRAVDGSVETAHVENLMRRYLESFGNDAVVCTLSPNNGTAQHRDHKAVGFAAEHLLNQGIVNEAYFFIEPYHIAQIVDNAEDIPQDSAILRASQDVEKHIRKAIDAYSYWNPDEGRFACGYHSVTNEFNDFLREKKCYYYSKCNEQIMTYWQRMKRNLTKRLEM